MPERCNYNLGHFVFNEGRIGSLQTQMCLPILPGDSIELSFRALTRLSDLRKNLMLNAVVDHFLFYDKMRYVYGNDTWKDFILGGIDETQTLGGEALSTTNDLLCCTGQKLKGTVAKWAIYPYARIWNNYFRDPDDASEIINDNYLSTLADGNLELRAGKPCMHMKSLWNTGKRVNEITSADNTYTISSGTPPDRDWETNNYH